MKKNGLDRRSFLRNTALTVAGAWVGCSKALSEVNDPMSDASVQLLCTGNPFPKWKGFNISEYFQPDPFYQGAPTPEEWFKWMAGWGFNFVRIPVAYPAYLDMPKNQRTITADDVYRIDENKVQKLEQLVFTAQKYHLHVSFNLHRAPGYCVSAGYQEPYHLWTDQAALDAFCHHWTMWARRFKSVPSSKISFNLINEPCLRDDVNNSTLAARAVPNDQYLHVTKAAVQCIRRIKPDAVIMIDGNNGNVAAIPELAALGVGQSCRGYYPFEISHYKAPWVFSDPAYPPYPQWPGEVGGRTFNHKLIEKYYQPWIELARQGVGVHCGECGCWKETPHNVFLAWLGDVLDILGQHGIGFALWEFSGDFGILNSNRKDVAYENWYGHKLDRKLLTLLQNK
jgi:Endoglucanase